MTKTYRGSWRLGRIAKKGSSVSSKLEEMFFRDDITRDITSVSVGSVWMVYYHEALVAATRYKDGVVDSAMVKRTINLQTIPIAYMSYAMWGDSWMKNGEKISDDFAIPLTEFKDVSIEELQSLALQWLGDQISSVVSDRLTGV